MPPTVGAVERLTRGLLVKKHLISTKPYIFRSQSLTDRLRSIRNTYSTSCCPEANNISNDSLETASQHRADENGRRRDLKDSNARGRGGSYKASIVPDDLDATLESHRAANRASVIHYSWSRSGPDTKPTDSSVSPAFIESGRNKPVPTSRHVFQEHNGFKRKPPEAFPKVLFARASDAGTLQRTVASDAPGRDIDERRKGKWTFPSQSTSSRGCSRPWRNFKRPACWSSTAEDRLQQEAEDLYECLMPTHKEEFVTRRLIRDLESRITNALPSCSVRLHGSRASGSHSVASNVNINVEYRASKEMASAGKRPFRLQSKFKEHALSKIRQACLAVPSSRYSVADGVNTPENALLLVDSKTGLDVFITIEAATIARTEVSKEFVAESKNHLYIYHLLRQSLVLRGLMSPSPSRMRSYMLMNMIMVALRHSTVHANESQSSIRAFKTGSFAEKLFGVLDYLTIDIPARLDSSVFLASPPFELPKYTARHVGSRPSSASRVDQLSSAQTQGLAEICRNNANRRAKLRASRLGTTFFSIQDPANPKVDLGAKCRNVQDCLAAVALIKQDLLERMSAWDISSPKLREANDEDLIDVFVLSPWRDFDRRRSMMGRQFELEDMDTDNSLHETDAETLQTSSGPQYSGRLLNSSKDVANIYGIIRRERGHKQPVRHPE